ncbi:activating signal cointegrator 1 complex subunit 3-like [Convolutriloba macropyga]|uniref:activating signal cointegrator 1 complex subunit 3-like n=1 Tax=Convolutriloba macropyga TaxID=536237 RepID=UPI003F51E6FD
MAYGGADDRSLQTVNSNGLMSSNGDSNGESGLPDLLSSDLSFSAMLEQFVEGTNSSCKAKSNVLSSLDSEVMLSGGFKSRTELYEFKRQQLEAFHSDCWSWKFLNEYLREQISESRYTELELTIKKFQDTSKELLGKEVDTTQIQAGVVYLIKTLRGTKYISNEQRHQLKLYFGDYNETPMNRAANLVEALEKISKMKVIRWNELDSPPKSEHLMDKPFGAGITLTPFNGVFPSVRCFLDENERPQVAENSAANGDVIYSLEWLIGQLKPKYSVKEQSLGLGVSEMASAVMELLKCKLKSNEDLQSELVELLGFDLIELVIEILAHRDAIVLGQDDATVRAQLESTATTSRGNQQRSAIDPEVLRKFLPKMPGNNNSGCQIVVQSEEEKELKKIVRKEEKRFKRLVGQNKEFEG